MMSVRMLVVLALLMITGCQDSTWQTKDVTGLLPNLQVSATRHDGESITQDDFRGRSVLLFFGFTYCPDVCPLTLSKMSRVVREIDPEGEDFVIALMTVDPGRDSIEQLAQYVGAFGDNVVGLRTDRNTLDEMVKRYRVTYGYGEPEESGQYDVSHSSAVFAFDRTGAMRLLIRESDPAAAIVADLSRLQ